MGAYSGWSPPNLSHGRDASQERRGSPRIDVELDASLVGVGDDAAEKGRVVNLSAGGALLRTSRAHAIGDVLRVTIRLASGDELEGSVKVCSRLAGQGNGVAFFNLAPEQRFAIEALVRREGAVDGSPGPVNRGLYSY